MNRSGIYNAGLAIALLLGQITMVSAVEVCQGYGPQAPRDITDSAGTNNRVFSIAPPASELNLCNLHTHTNAEHKGPGFQHLPAEQGMEGISVIKRQN